MPRMCRPCCTPRPSRRSARARRPPAPGRAGELFTVEKDRECPSRSRPRARALLRDPFSPGKPSRDLDPRVVSFSRSDRRPQRRRSPSKDAVLGGRPRRAWPGIRSPAPRPAQSRTGVCTLSLAPALETRRSGLVVARARRAMQTPSAFLLDRQLGDELGLQHALGGHRQGIDAAAQDVARDQRHDEAREDLVAPSSS